MSGTYEIDGAQFPTNPLTKRWSREQVGVQGNGAPIYGAFWQLELGWDRLATATDNAFFEAYYLNGGLHTIKVPHPLNAALTQFTGTAITEYSYEIDDVERDSWAVSPRMLIGHINILATGTP
jgi:hypothetical protein